MVNQCLDYRERKTIPDFFGGMLIHSPVKCDNDREHIQVDLHPNDKVIINSKEHLGTGMILKLFMLNGCLMAMVLFGKTWLIADVRMCIIYGGYNEYQVG
jgi:hypothetical protein